ncbi:hypothetical protein ACDF64_13125 [Agromyces sp. MMS24-JH15]|uniref:hypothetical protein n=1 Tax=Agromyces sp. MMS24-JH15 TaxID=3243765 RepID=UPI0037499F9E
MSLVTAILAETETVNARELPIEPFFYGLIAFSIFIVLAFVAASYRDVANRHRAKAEAYAARHGGDAHAGH